MTSSAESAVVDVVRIAVRVPVEIPDIHIRKHRPDYVLYLHVALHDGASLACGNVYRFACDGMIYGLPDGDFDAGKMIPSNVAVEDSELHNPVPVDVRLLVCTSRNFSEGEISSGLSEVLELPANEVSDGLGLLDGRTRLWLRIKRETVIVGE